MRIAAVLLGLSLSISANALAQSQNEARKLVENAIRAQGGAEMVAKLRSMRMTLEGTTDFIASHPGLQFKEERTWQMPDKHRTTSTIQYNGRSFVRTEVLNGKGGWRQADGKTEELSPSEISELQDQYYVEDLDRLAFLNDRSIQLSTIDDIDVDGKTASGVVVRSKGHKDVKLYFDQTSGLLVKREHRLFDSLLGRDMTQETYFKDYRRTNGLVQYGRLVLYRDGKKVVDARVTEANFLVTPDASLFAMP